MAILCHASSLSLVMGTWVFWLLICFFKSIYWSITSLKVIFDLLPQSHNTRHFNLQNLSNKAWRYSQSHRYHPRPTIPSVNPSLLYTPFKPPGDEYKKRKESEAGGAPVVHSTGHWDWSLLSIRLIIIRVGVCRTFNLSIDLRDESYSV